VTNLNSLTKIFIKKIHDLYLFAFVQFYCFKYVTLYSGKEFTIKETIKEAVKIHNQNGYIEAMCFMMLQNSTFKLTPSVNIIYACIKSLYGMPTNLVKPTDENWYSLYLALYEAQTGTTIKQYTLDLKTINGEPFQMTFS
jgi:hypothetical protein